MALTEAQIETIRGEVEDSDVYRMRFRDNIVSINDPNYVHEWGHARGFDFEPDVIFDLGANCVMFSRYAKKLFPKARIISVEPDPENLALFHSLGVPDVLLETAIGIGDIYRINGAINGGGESYLSVGLGYSKKELAERGTKTNLKAVRLNDLVNQYVKDGQKFIVKMDMEGAENIVFSDVYSMNALLMADYFTCELHFYAADRVDIVKEETERALTSFELTHNCFRNGIHFHATKR